MIDQLKVYGLSILTIVLLTTIAISRYELYSITKEYKEYKENINDQVQKAIVEKNKIESEQKSKLDKAKTDYSTARRDLDSILDRLRNGEVVSRDESLQVAGSSPSCLSKETGNSSRTITALAVGGGICDADFYAKAIREHIQCKYLIELVK